MPYSYVFEGNQIAVVATGHDSLPSKTFTYYDVLENYIVKCKLFLKESKEYL